MTAKKGKEWNALAFRMALAAQDVSFRSFYGEMSEALGEDSKLPSLHRAYEPFLRGTGHACLEDERVVAWIAKRLGVPRAKLFRDPQGL